jgi:hypothetical protein
MEATLFTGWIFDFLKPHAFKITVAHPEMLKAITAAKKKEEFCDTSLTYCRCGRQNKE